MPRKQIHFTVLDVRFSFRFGLGHTPRYPGKIKQFAPVDTLERLLRYGFESVKCHGYRQRRGTAIGVSINVNQILLLEYPNDPSHN